MNRRTGDQKTMITLTNKEKEIKEKNESYVMVSPKRKFTPKTVMYSNTLGTAITKQIEKKSKQINRLAANLLGGSSIICFFLRRE